MCFKSPFSILVIYLVVSQGLAWGQSSDEKQADDDLEKGDYHAAIAAYTRALDLDPKNARLICCRGCAYDFLMDHEHAIQDINQAIALEPNFAKAYANRACAFNSLHQTDKALADLNKAIELDPKMEAAYATRGSIYGDIGKMDLSFQDENTAISINSSDAIAYLDRAVDYSQTGDYAKAIADFSQAISLGSPEDSGNDFDALHTRDMRGQCYLNINELDLALADANFTVQSEPGNTIHLLLRANIYDKKLDYENALKDLGAIVKLDRNNSFAYSLAGKIRNKQGNYIMAKQNFQKALDLVPDNSNFNNLLAWLLATCPDASVRDGKRAVVLAQKACDLNPDKPNPGALDTLAAAFAEAGDFANAVKTENDAIKALQKASLKFEARLALYQRNQSYQELPDPR